MNVNFDVVQVFEENGKLFPVLESLEDVDYSVVKQRIDAYMSSHWCITSEAIYVMKKSYKKHEFDKRLTKDRGVCGIKLPTVLKEKPALDEIEEIVSGM